MALLGADLVTFFKKYFDTLTAGALKCSPYATTKDGQNIDELVSNATDIIDAGRMERFDSSAQARNSVEKTTTQVFRCMSSTEETKLCEDLQNDVVEKIVPLLLDETCCNIVATLYLGRPLVWSR